MQKYDILEVTGIQNALTLKESLRIFKYSEVVDNFDIFMFHSLTI